jgi:hypothetical protein
MRKSIIKLFRSKCVSAVFVLFILSFAVPDLFSQAFDNPGVGARPRALSGTYAAIADDSYSIFWNPAGLGRIKKKELAVSYEDMYGLNLLNYGSVAYVHPGIAKGTVGFAWTRFGTAAQVDSIDYAENTFIIAYGRKLDDRLSLGGSLKYYSLNYVSRASGIGVDFGAGYELIKHKLNAGLAWHNLNNPIIRWDTQASDKLASDINTALAWRLIGDQLIAIGMDTKVDTKPEYSFGWEGWFVEKSIAFRAGVTTQDTEANYAVGTSLSLGGGFKLDYTLEKHYTLGFGSLFGVSAQF